MRKIRVGDIVRITSGRREQFDEIAVVSHVPNLKARRFHYELCTLDYPDGLWHHRWEFYYIGEGYLNIEERKKILARRNRHRLHRKYMPINRDSKSILVEMSGVYLPPIGTNPEMFIWTEDDDGKVPFIHVIFRGEKHGKEALIRLDKPKYFHRWKSYKLNDDEKLAFIRVLNEKSVCGKGNVWEEQVLKKFRHSMYKKYLGDNPQMPDYMKLK